MSSNDDKKIQEMLKEENELKNFKIEYMKRNIRNQNRFIFVFGVSMFFISKWLYDMKSDLHIVANQK